MSLNTLTYEQGTHFLSNVALSIERCYNQIEKAILTDNPVIHHHTLFYLVDLLQLTEKSGLKNRFLKELLRFEHILAKEMSVDNRAIFAILYVHVHELSQHDGYFGIQLKEDAFLQHIIQHIQLQKIEGAPSTFIQYWLSKSSAERQANLSQWLSPLSFLKKTIDIYLSILRSHLIFSELSLEKNTFQQHLPSQLPCHLVQLTFKDDVDFYPKIQTGQHGIHIRIYDGKTLKDVRSTPILMSLGFSIL
jgi:cell division protein ZapD